MMSVAVAITTKHNAISTAGVTAPGYRLGLPTVDLREDGLHFWVTQFVFGVPPVERAQWLIDCIPRRFCLRNEAQRKLMNEPCVGSTIPGRVDRFFAPLQEPLRVCERAFFFGVTGAWKAKDFRLDLFRFQLAALNCRRIA